MIIQQSVQYDSSTVIQSVTGAASSSFNFCLISRLYARPAIEFTVLILTSTAVTRNPKLDWRSRENHLKANTLRPYPQPFRLDVRIAQPAVTRAKLYPRPATTALVKGLACPNGSASGTGSGNVWRSATRRTVSSFLLYFVEMVGDF